MPPICFLVGRSLRRHAKNSFRFAPHRHVVNRAAIGATRRKTYRGARRSAGRSMELRWCCHMRYGECPMTTFSQMPRRAAPISSNACDRRHGTRSRRPRDRVSSTRRQRGVPPVTRFSARGSFRGGRLARRGGARLPAGGLQQCARCLETAREISGRWTPCRRSYDHFGEPIVPAVARCRQRPLLLGSQRAMLGEHLRSAGGGHVGVIIASSTLFWH